MNLACLLLGHAWTYNVKKLWKEGSRCGQRRPLK